MKKMMFKKILAILDAIEIHGIEVHDLAPAILKELGKESIYEKEQHLHQFVQYLYDHHFLRDTTRGADLSPSATIFSKSDSNSRVEALSIFECLYQCKEFRQNLQSLMMNRVHKIDLYSYFDEISYSILTQTSLFYEESDFVRLRKEYLQDIQSIIDEYEVYGTDSLLLSVTLCARYTSSIVSHEDPSIDYKNKSNQIVPYDRLPSIIRIIPRRGVPNDRNETKALQTFYKDTLFHECDHACPICEIDIPHMLIASHIKPFRDCAHIYEAIDHNNGLLLCRNHDYLFDQGYLSFADDGKILISQYLQKKANLVAYHVDPEYHLSEHLLTKERRLFLAYHREFIYKK